MISSSGGHIIAVANPALALSPTFSDTISNIKREVVSPDIWTEIFEQKDFGNIFGNNFDTNYENFYFGNKDHTQI